MRALFPTSFQRWWHSSASAAAPASPRALPTVFGLWILAFTLKHTGASWDVAWHFRFLRDDLIPPHIINLSGNALALALLCFQLRTGLALEPRGLLMVIGGFALFIAALPLDLLNHRLFGLDVTIWSIPHLMFFFGSTIALVGLLWMWLRLAAPDRWKTAYTLIFLTFLTDCAIFVLGQHEYGVLTVDAYLKGHPTASNDLLALARGNVVGFATGHVPPWIYPIWMVLAGTAVLLAARRALPGRWTATIVAALYLAYRAVAYLLLIAAGFPPSSIPLMLLGAGFTIDLAAGRKWRPAITAAALLLAFYGGAALVGHVTLMPAFAPLTAVAIAAPLWAMVAAANRWQAAPPGTGAITRVQEV
jgi:hypothetical protein